MRLRPTIDATPSYAGPCSHQHEPGSHVPFAGYSATCPGCGDIYSVRGCGDSTRKRTLPPDPKSGGVFGVVNVACTCGSMVDVGVPPEAIPATLIASLSSPRT